MPRGPVEKMRAHKRIVINATLALVAGLVLCACGPGNIVRSEPQVRFTRPRAAVLFVRADGVVARIRFDGKLRLAPFTCAATAARVHTAESTSSLMYSLKLMSQQPGSKRVQLHDVDGKVIARGTFCIFPTLKTPTKAILHHYDIELPPQVMKRLRSGKPVAVFQDYVPFEIAKPGWNHLAWVLYLEHHSMQ